MISFKNTLQKNMTGKYQQPRRSQIFVGFQCHQNCQFCYYKSRNTEPMFDREYVIRQIDLLQAYGVNDIEITGGEPSECKDLRYYCEYIKKNNPSAKISVITNGGLYASDIWDLIDEVLVSYHVSKDDPNIDLNIFPHGHTYHKVKKTIDKARENNVFVRMNTVIASFNIDGLDYVLNDIVEFNPIELVFLPVNLFDEAWKNMSDFINYNNLRQKLKNAIDYIKEKLPETLILVRYMPYCDMEGYEKHLVGIYQNAFDWFSWNLELCGTLILNFLDKYKTNEEILKVIGNYGDTTFEAAERTREAHYEKTYECLTCKYNLICDGVEKTKDHKLVFNIKPKRGKMITDINYYLKNTTYDLYHKIYNRIT